MAPRSSSTSPTKKSSAGGHKKNNSSSSKIGLPRKSIPAPLTRLKFIPQRTATAARQQLPASLAQAGPSRATSIRMSPSPSKLVPAAASAAANTNPSAAPLSPGGAAGLRQLRLLNTSTIDLPGTAGSLGVAASASVTAAAPTPATAPTVDRSPPPSRLPLAIVPSSRKPVPPGRNPARPPPVINQVSPNGTTTTFIFPAPPRSPAPPPATTSSLKLPRVRGIPPPSPPPRFPPPAVPPTAYIPVGARRGVSAPIRFLSGTDAGALLAPPPAAAVGRGRGRGGRGGMPARGGGRGGVVPPRWPIPNFSRPLWRVRYGRGGGGGGGAWPQRSSSMPVAPAGPVGVALSQSLPGRLSALPEAGLVPFERLVEEEKEKKEEEEDAAWPLADKPLPPLPKKDN